MIPTTDPIRIIDTDSSRRRECTLIATLLDLGGGKIGPNVSSALAHCPQFWDDPLARIVGVAIKACVRVGRPITLCSVSEFLPRDSRHLLGAREFEDGLPMSLAEIEAYDLLLRYRGKRLAAVLGMAWQQAREHPERADVIRRSTIKELEEF